jgi:5-methylcytosine-specific restriction endonuclease McrA
VGDRTCSVPGCAGKYKAAGLCIMHYERKRKNGTTDPKQPPAPRRMVEGRRVCAVETCTRKYGAAGYCRRHHELLRDTGSLTDPRDEGRREPRIFDGVRRCEFESCDGKYLAKGYCAKHYQRSVDGRPMEDPTPRTPQERHAARLAAGRRYYERNRESELAKNREYRARNRERLNAASLEWHKRNPGRNAENTRRWREANPERVAQRNSEWYARNPDWSRTKSGRRRAMKLATQVEPVDYAVILERHGMQCHICKAPIESKAVLHFDHVVPLVRGGTHTYDNIKPAHSRCNLSKHAKLLPAEAG